MAWAHLDSVGCIKCTVPHTGTAHNSCEQRSKSLSHKDSVFVMFQLSIS